MDAESLVIKFRMLGWSSNNVILHLLVQSTGNTRKLKIGLPQLPLLMLLLIANMHAFLIFFIWPVLILLMILDCGCSNHLTCCRDIFDAISIIDYLLYFVKNIDDLSLTLSSNSYLFMNNFYCVLSLKKKFILILQILDRVFYFILFGLDSIVIYVDVKVYRKQIMHGRKVNKPYIISNRNSYAC